MNTKHLELQPMQPKQPGTMDLYRALLRMRANGWTVGKHFAKPAPQRRARLGAADMARNLYAVFSIKSAPMTVPSGEALLWATLADITKQYLVTRQGDPGVRALLPSDIHMHRAYSALRK